MTKVKATDERGMGVEAFVIFRQPFISGVIDESLAAQVVDSSLSTLFLSLFYQYIGGVHVSPPREGLEREKH
jgi:hypothetical protein